MRDLIAILVIVSILAFVLGAMMVNAGQEEKLRASAQRFIDEAAQGKWHPVPNDEVVFRKPKFPGYVFLVLFVAVFLVVRFSMIYSDNAFHTAVRPLTTSQVSELVLLSLLPLSFAIRQFRYKVRVSQDELTISDLTTKTVPLRGITDVRIGVSRASSFCQIRLMTGEEDLKVGSDLRNFPEFVRLLCGKVNKSKTRS